ncbi:MAG: hypothetical protein JKY65_00100 [Planctomycetes bacterium]|nr:hypothetical protein [Planctomycetota bacterium]
MTIKQGLSALCATLLLTLCGGCTGVYYGGPDDSDQPHALIRPGVDVTIWKVDGQPTTRHSFEVMVAPGRRKILIRVEHPMESESPIPHDRTNVIIDCKDGMTYHLERRPGEGAPYEVDVSEAPFR